jgi:hypothetical protein
MIIKLIRTGGFIPLAKEADADVDISAKELATLLEKIQSDPDAPRVKDGTSYAITVGNETKAVDLDKVPVKYQALFSKLKKDLKIINK